jgi:hypothetical protein
MTAYNSRNNIWKNALRMLRKHCSLIVAGGLTVAFISCSTLSSVPEGDQLFVGLKPITYTDHRGDESRHVTDTKVEVEAALASAPNGALFGSSYYRTPLPWRLWIYNTYSRHNSPFSRWITRTFGKAPVLMSQVNPALRASVAQSVLRNHGYFRGKVSYETIPMKHLRKAKIAYHVTLDSLFTFDSIAYVGFPAGQQQLIDSTMQATHIVKGQPFTVTSLEDERSRLSNLLRNNGYFYYHPNYTTFQADTINSPGRVDILIHLADALPNEALRKWSIGHADIIFRKSFSEESSDSIFRRNMSIWFNGKKPPIRPRVVTRSIRLRPRQLFSYDKYQQTIARMNATGVFSSVDFQFTPRPAATDTILRSLLNGRTSPVANDTLDFQLSCTFDKPYDFYFETNINGRTIGRYGPEAKVGFTKRNAFRGAEKLDINLHGAYEWQSSSESGMNSYQYGADAAIEFPRIIAPFVTERSRRRTRAGQQGDSRSATAGATMAPRYRNLQRTTYAKVSTDIVRRPGYYKMHIATGEWTYRWQSSEQSTHEFSPLTLKYQYMNSHTATFDSILTTNPYISTTMQNQFIPQMRYTYLYKSPAHHHNPIRWETTISESGNVTALYDVLIQGHEWNQTGKTLFKNSYAQFVRLETDFTKTWMLAPHSQLVGHVNAGIMRSFGNSHVADSPFSEMFYAGGANSIRAFTVRSIGPGEFYAGNSNKKFSYAMQNGDLKFVANLEYRTRLSGNLNGAVFLDAGNVWNWEDFSFGQETGEETQETDPTVLDAFNRMYTNTSPKLKRLGRQVALGTGVGLRYDMGFLVVRLDWGLALHAPYDTGHRGYFNINRFKDAQTLHFAIGYPF